MNSVTYNMDILKARVIAAAPRLKKITEEEASRLDREISEAAVVDMPMGGKGRNSTPFLRIQTGALFRSYHEQTNQYHVFKMQWNGWKLKILTGSAQVSPRGFPYALYWEQHDRPHLTRAMVEVRNKTNSAKRLAEAYAKALNA